METNIDSICNWIKTKRKLQRERILNKKITIPLFKENDKQISAKTAIIYDKNTENVVISHGLYYMGNAYHPTTNKKLKCINKHTIEQYEKALDYDHKKIRSKQISFKLNKYMRLSTRTVYNLNTNSIRITDMVYYKAKHIIIN